MSYMDRGDSSSDGDDGNSVNESIRDFRRGDYYYYNDTYYYPASSTYVLMQMIATFIILITGVVALVITYKSDIIDPIENMKKLYINTYLIINAIFLVLTFIINFLSKNETTLIKKLVILFIISVITMISFFVVRLNLDLTYNNERFEEFYYEQNTEDNAHLNEALNQKIEVGITGVSIKTEKQHYIDECIKLYEIFKTKTYTIFAVHLLLNILLIYQILKMSKIKKQKAKLNKDDIVLFDEEENVKI